MRELSIKSINKPMKNNTVRLGAALLGVVVTTGLVAVSTNAFSGGGFFKRGLSEKGEAAKTAIESGDYDAFVEAVSDSPIAEKINEETFAKLQEAHEQMEAGNYEEAKAIKEELGFNGFGRGGMGHRMKGFDPERHEAVKTALDAEDFTAWQEAVGEDSKVYEIIDTEAEFNRLLEAHDHMQAAKEIMEELGMPDRHGWIK